MIVRKPAVMDEDTVITLGTFPKIEVLADNFFAVVSVFCSVDSVGIRLD